MGCRLFADNLIYDVTVINIKIQYAIVEIFQG